MSLRGFHITFVVVSSLLMIYMINWSLAMSDSRGDGYELYTVFATTGLVLLAFYGVRFFNFYNESFKIKTKINIYNIFIYSISFAVPPIGIINYFLNRNKSITKNILKSILIGTVLYLVILFGYISYFIEKNSLEEYKKKLELNSTINQNVSK